MRKNGLKKIRFLLIFLVNFAHALDCPPQPPAGNCGYKAHEIRGVSTAAMGGVDRSTNDIVTNSLWTGFACPTINDTEATLLDLDISSGRFSCRYHHQTDSLLNGTCAYQNTQCLKNDNAIRNASEAEINNFQTFERFGMLESPFRIPQNWFTVKLTNYTTSFPAISRWFANDYKFDFTSGNDGLLGILNKTDTDFRNLKNGAKTSVINLSELAEDAGLLKIIPNNAQEKVRLSSFATGILTLDTDIVVGVKPDGTIEFKQEITNTFISGVTGINQISTYASNRNQVQNQIFSMADIFDSKIWGYFVTYIYNLNDIFQKFVLFIFMLGGAYLIAIYGYQILVMKITHENNNINQAFLTKLFTVVLAFVFFTVPVFESNLQMQNKEMLVDKSKINQDNYSEYSTIYQSFIQYFAQLSSHFADVGSEYAVYSFAGFLEAKNEVLLDKTQYSTEIKSVFSTMHLADQYGRFYRNTCTPGYQNYWGEKSTFLRTKEENTEFMHKGFFGENGTNFLKNELGVENLTLDLCQKTELRAINLTMTGMQDYFELQNRLMLLDVNGLENHAKATNAIVRNMFAQQDDLGWINIASVPFQYFIFENADTFADSGNSNSKSDDISNKISNMEVAKNEANFGEKITSSLEQSSGSVLGAMVGFHAMSALPGYSGIQNNLTKFFENFTKGENGTKVSNRLTRKIKDFATKLQKGPIGFLLNTILSKGSELGFATLIFLSVAFISSILYLNAIKLVLGIVVGIIALLRIVFFFITLMKYYIMSPIIVVWTLTTNQSNKIFDFIGQGVVLFITPLLIVVSVSIFIFANEFMHTIYNFVLGMIVHNTQVNFTTMSSIAEDNVMASISTFATFIAIDMMFQMILGILSLILAYKIIFSDEWFMGLFGWNPQGGGVTNSKLAGESLGRAMNPVR